MVPAVRPLGSLSMARGCARIVSRPDTAKIGSADRVEVHHARLLAVIGVRKTFPHGLGHSRRFRDVRYSSDHRQFRICCFGIESIGIIGIGVIRPHPSSPRTARSKIRESERGRLAPADRSARSQGTARAIAKSRSRLRAAPAPSRRIDARRYRTRDGGWGCGRCRDFPDRQIVRDRGWRRQCTA